MVLFMVFGFSLTATLSLFFFAWKRLRVGEDADAPLCLSASPAGPAGPAVGGRARRARRAIGGAAPS